MNFYTFPKLIKSEAESLRIDAAYGGAHNDGGKLDLLIKLREFRDKLQTKYDLRPSELYKLDELEIEIPEEFERVMDDIKHRYFNQITEQKLKFDINIY